MQQAQISGLAYPHTQRVIAAVQRPHRSRQWFTVLGRRQRIPVGTHHDPRAAVAAAPKKPAVPSPPIAPTHIAQSSACGPRTI